MAPVVGLTPFTFLSLGVGWADTLASVRCTIVLSVGTVTRCASAILEAVKAARAAVTLVATHARPAAALPALAAVLRDCAQQAAVTGAAA